MTPFGEVEEEGKRKFQEDLDDIHRMFQDHVAENRTQLDIDDVATGESWLALQVTETAASTSCHQLGTVEPLLN